MNELSYELHADTSAITDIAKLLIYDEDKRLLSIVHVNTTYGATFEIVDFEHYGDYLGHIVKAAKILKTAKAADIDAVKAALEGAILYTEKAQA